MNGTGPSVAASTANAANWAVSVLVAGTACSSPAPSASTTSLAAASGDSGSLVIATARPPVARSRSTTSTISGVAPDWLTPTTSQPEASVRAP